MIIFFNKRLFKKFIFKQLQSKKIGKILQNEQTEPDRGYPKAYVIRREVKKRAIRCKKARPSMGCAFYNMDSENLPLPIAFFNSIKFAPMFLCRYRKSEKGFTALFL